MAIFQRQLAQVVAVRNQSPRFLADRALREALFPATDPSLRDATAKSVSSLTMADLKAYYTKVFRPDETTIVVMGKITPEEAEAAVLRSFGAWKAVGPKPQTDLPAAPPNKAVVVAVPDHSRVQDSVMLAETMGLTRTDPSYYALKLGNAVLGGGFYSTRLSIDLRKNAGLVYTVDSSLICRAEPRHLHDRLCLRSQERIARGGDRHSGCGSDAQGASLAGRDDASQGAAAQAHSAQPGEL